MQADRWRRVSVCAEIDRVDVVTDAFVMAGCSGTVINDDEGRAWVCGFFPVDADGESGLEQLRERLRVAVQEVGGIDLDSLKSCLVVEDDWAEGWKNYFSPCDVGKRFRVIPSWMTYEGLSKSSVDGCRIPLILNPGMAFGTGQHATTRLCLELMEDYVRPGDVVADVGTGSGILAIAACKLGASQVVAIDHDALAIAAAIENMRRNLPEYMLTVDSSTLRCLAKVRWHEERIVAVVHADFQEVNCRRFDLVVANLTSAEIVRLAERIEQLLVSGGSFVASGIAPPHHLEVEKSLQHAGIKIERRVTLRDDHNASQSHPDGEDMWIAYAAHLSSE